MPKKPFTVFTSDKDQVEIFEDTINEMITISDMIKDIEYDKIGLIPVDVDTDLFLDIFQYCNDKISGKFRLSSKLTKTELLNLIRASNYLNIDYIHKSACENLGKLIEDKSLDEIYEFFNISSIPEFDIQKASSQLEKNKELAFLICAVNQSQSDLCQLSIDSVKLMINNIDYGITNFDNISSISISGRDDIKIASNGKINGTTSATKQGSSLILSSGSSSSSNFSNTIGFGNNMRFGSGVSINGRNATIGGITYTIPKYNSISIINNQIYLDNKLWIPQSEPKQKPENKPEEEKPKTFFLRNSLIKDVTLSGNSSAVIDNKFLANEIKFNISGSSSCAIENKSFDKIKLALFGNSEINLKNVSATKKLKIECSGSSSVENNNVTSDDLIISCNENSCVKGPSTCTFLNVNCTGCSTVKGVKVWTSANLNASGNSDIKISADSQCKINKNKSGNADIKISKN